jgi:predicted transglutaminase-like cysteine proteinase
MLLLIGLLCRAAQAAGQPDPLADATARRAAAKWRDVLARIDSEEETLAACCASLDACSPAARRLLQLVELGRQRAGRARLGEINRAVNLSIKATSDRSQYGVDDFWSAPLATIEKGAGEIPGASRSRCQPR